MTEQTETYTKLQKLIKIKFHNLKHLRMALTHPSFVNEVDEELSSYQRLEFFGDAILEFIASEQLYKRFQEIQEGRLTEIRAALVRTENLAKCARKINLGDYLFLSKGEHLNSGRNNENILADDLAALMGAIYLDQGLEVVKAFFNTYILEELEEIVEKKLYLDAKTVLQEKLQASYKITPQYKLIKEVTNKDMETIFVVGVYKESTLIAEGSGRNKKRAEQAAAVNALSKLK
jgi:ribonuclease-3